jgi:hypothetical protein
MAHSFILTWAAYEHGNMSVIGKEAIKIARFEGMVGSADAHDLGPGAASLAENIDMIQQKGLFTPLPADSAIGSNSFGNCQKLQPFDDGSIATLVDRNTNTLRVVSIETMANVTSTAVTPGDDDCAASDGESVHVGLGGASGTAPKWVGTIFHEQFGSATAATNQIHDAVLERATCVGANPESGVSIYMPTETRDADGNYIYMNGENVFSHGFTYVYFASLVYDGHQEAPMAPIFVFRSDMRSASASNIDGTLSADTSSLITVLTSAGGAFSRNDVTTPAWSGVILNPYQEACTDSDFRAKNSTPATGIAKIKFSFKVRVATSGSGSVLPRRVTGINIYRTSVQGFWSADPLFAAYNPTLPEPIHLEYISTNAATGWSAAAAGGDATETDLFNKAEDTYRTYTITDDQIDAVDTFSARAGYPSTLSHMRVHYGLSCSTGSYHIVGKAYVEDLNEVESWLFRSKVYKYDTFDWAKDFLVLPAEPTALAAWAGRVYAFAKGRTFVINPGTFDIEETWEGVGCEQQAGVTVTDRGMFWSDQNNIYWHDGSSLHPIGGPVLRNQVDAEAAWLSRDTTVSTSRPVVVYDSRYDAAMFIYMNAAKDALRGLMYHVESKRWCALTFAHTGPAYCAAQLPTGQAILGADITAGVPKWYELFGSGSDRSWRWVSPQITSYDVAMKYYQIRLGYKSARPTTIAFYDDDPNFTTPHTINAGTWTAVGSGGKLEEGELTLDGAKTWLTLREFALNIVGSGTQDLTHMIITRRAKGGVR